jgi:ammonium transporter, Amt family
VPAVNATDTTWVLVSAALVLFMTPGLALFYGGMVRAKNVLAVMMNNYAAIGVVSVLWAIVAFSLAFGPGDPGRRVPGLDLTQHAESAYSLGGMGRIGN